MALVFTWQFLTVRVNYGGNWTALFCTGARLGAPSVLAPEHIYQFPNSYGFDGQMYHYVAHDPLMRNAELRSFVDAPWLRYRRILLPGLAFLLAGGQAAWIDKAYYALVLMFTGAGVYWLGLYCAERGFSAAWGLLFVWLPATLVSMDRMVLDVALAALAAAYLLTLRRPSWKLFVVLSAAILTRETGLLFLVGYCFYLLLQRRPARAALYSLAAIPALGWYAYVRAHTPSYGYSFSLIPFSAIWANLVHPMVYAPTVRLRWLATLGDRIALIGIVAAFLLVIFWFVRRWRDPIALVALAFVAMGVVMQRHDHWAHVYDYGRVYSPVLLFLGMESLERRSWLGLVPLGMLLPRIGMQFGTQILGLF